MRFKGQKGFCFLLTITLLSSCGGGGGSSGSNSNTPSVSLSSSSISSQSSSSASSIADLTECELLNFKSDETISYKLPILYGHCSTAETIVDIEVAGKTYTWPVINGYFKGPVLLYKGINEIRLSARSKTVYAKLRYEPSSNPQKVQMVYAIAANDDGHYLAAAGEPNDMESAKKRLILESLMMQSATAEMMYKATGEHQTFALVEDENGEPIINTFQMPQTREMLYALAGETIYYSIRDLLKTEEQSVNKYMVTMGFSSYEKGVNLAHTALGGNNLAVFGSLHLHTCPSTLDEITASFSNVTRIDTTILPDDSAGRGTYWANCATGMGASLHELGHTFGLPHTDYGIMSRGFDHFNRLFMITEPNYSRSPITQENEYDAIWHPAFADHLLEHQAFRARRAQQVLSASGKGQLVRRDLAQAG
ncbi:MAG: hypothetical protein EOO68_29995, partial [Moraxellaceae bacterium]